MIGSCSKKRSDHLILKSRHEAQVHEVKLREIHNNTKLLNNALWERSSIIRARRGSEMRRFTEFSNRKEESLVLRRRRLMQLFELEKEQFEAELTQQDKTSAQRRQDMLNRATQLKNQREEHERAFAEEKLQKKWRSSLDELRLQDSRLKQLEVVAHRDEQLRFKASEKRQENAEESFYNAMWEEDRKKKDEDAERRDLVRRQRNEMTKNVLQEQLEESNMQALKRKEEKALDEAESRKQASELVEEQKQMTIQKEVAAFEKRQAFDECILRQHQEKIEQSLIAREQDKIHLANCLREEAKLLSREKKEAEMWKVQNVEYRKALEEQSKREKESDTQLIKCQAEASEKQWAIRQDQWDLEEKRKEKLRKEVDTSRRGALDEKLSTRRDAQERTCREKEENERKYREFEEETSQLAKTEKLKTERYRQEIANQIEDKAAREEREKEQVQLEWSRKCEEDRLLEASVLAEKKKQEVLMEQVQENRRFRQRAAASTARPF